MVPVAGTLDGSKDALLFRRHPDLDLRERHLLQHLAAVANGLRTHQQAGILLGPQAHRVARGIVRLQREHLAIHAGHPLRGHPAHVVELEHIVLVGGKQRGEAVLGFLLLHHHQLGFRNQAVHHVILAQHLARLAVQRFQALVLVVDQVAVMLDARRMHDAAALVDQRADVVLALRGFVDLVEPGGGVASVQRTVRRLRGCRCSSQTQGQKKGPTQGPNSLCARYIGGRPSFMHVRHYSCVFS
ncbi:hypothetical protein D9M69_463300 [compost metagenome]